VAVVRVERYVAGAALRIADSGAVSVALSSLGLALRLDVLDAPTPSIGPPRSRLLCHRPALISRRIRGVIDVTDEADQLR
jgi:hypothetical protein